MRFYSYNYLLEQIAKFDWWGAALTIFLIICLIITMFKYHQRQKETKFRELAIALVIGIFSLSLLIFFYYLRGVDTEKPTILLKLLRFSKN